VTIAGNTVEPLRPLAPRPGYDHGSGYVGAGNTGRSPVYGVQPGGIQTGNGVHTVYVPQPSHPIQSQSGYRPSGSYTPPSRPVVQPSHPSYGGGGYSGGHSSPAPAPAPHSSPAPSPHK
jgi:hypothetical protein